VQIQKKEDNNQYDDYNQENAYKKKDKKERTRATHIITRKIMGNFNQEKGGGKP